MSQKSQFPRLKKDDLQEARNHLEYFKRKSAALEWSMRQEKEDLRISEKEIMTWTARIEKLEAA